VAAGEGPAATAAPLDMRGLRAVMDQARRQRRGREPEDRLVPVVEVLAADAAARAQRVEVALEVIVVPPRISTGTS
jgi:hypothetical protein